MEISKELSSRRCAIVERLPRQAGRAPCVVARAQHPLTNETVYVLFYSFQRRAQDTRQTRMAKVAKASEASMESLRKTDNALGVSFKAT